MTIKELGSGREERLVGAGKNERCFFRVFPISTASKNKLRLSSAMTNNKSTILSMFEPRSLAFLFSALCSVATPDFSGVDLCSVFSSHVDHFSVISGRPEVVEQRDSSFLCLWYWKFPFLETFSNAVPGLWTVTRSGFL